MSPFFSLTCIDFLFVKLIFNYFSLVTFPFITSHVYKLLLSKFYFPKKLPVIRFICYSTSINLMGFSLFSTALLYTQVLCFKTNSEKISSKWICFPLTIRIGRKSRQVTWHCPNNAYYSNLKYGLKKNILVLGIFKVFKLLWLNYVEKQ